MKEKQEWFAKYVWQEQTDGTAKILRVYASEHDVMIPDNLEGYPVSVIGAYCFSDVEKLPDDSLRETVLSAGKLQDDSLRETVLSAGKLQDDMLQETVVSAEDSYSQVFRVIAGSDLERLVLPDRVVEIQDFAFYNCKKLQKLQMGKKTRKLGSDVFMNCRSLKTIEIRGGVVEPSGAAMALQQLSSEIEIHFLGSEQGFEAVLLYPEYSESYDEIAPAHIFGRNITGEGFRARQLFADGVVQLERYDGTLDKMAAEESGLTVGRMALFRLLYPVGLRQEKRTEYEKQLRLHALETVKYYIALRKLDILQKMCEKAYLQGNDLDEAIAYSTDQDWSEGSACLLDWKQRYGMTDRRKRYLF